MDNKILTEISQKLNVLISISFGDAQTIFRLFDKNGEKIQGVGAYDAIPTDMGLSREDV